jgi:hypothetical protein
MARVTAKLHAIRSQLRIESRGMGEPVVELPIERVFFDRTQGKPRALICISDLIGVVERLITENGMSVNA